MTPSERANQIWCELGWEQIVDATFKQKVKHILSKHIADAERIAAAVQLEEDIKVLSRRDGEWVKLLEIERRIRHTEDLLRQ